MSRAQWLLLAAAACAALTGCAPLDALPYAYEIEDTVLLRTLGVDMATQRLDGVAVTASSGERPAVGDSPGQAGVVLSAQADTVSAARTMMQSYGKDELFFGDVEQVVVGEGLAQRGLDDLLALMARDPELRLEAELWVVKGGRAADLLLEATDTPHAPWHVIWNEEKGAGTLEVLTIIRDALAAAVREGAPRPVPAAVRRFPLREVPPLSAVDLSPKVSDEDYHRELKREKKKQDCLICRQEQSFYRLVRRLAKPQLPVVKCVAIKDLRTLFAQMRFIMNTSIFS